jgi:enoyl-CoA hydratase
MTAWTLEHHDGVAVLTFRREPANWMDLVSMGELADHLAALAEQTDTVRVVMLTGGLDGYFIAHADLDDLAKLANGEPIDGDLSSWARALHLLGSMPQPTVAAIDGQAWGGGCETSLACTMRIGSTRAHLGQPEIVVGIIPGAGGTQRLPRLVGEALGAELCLTGRIVQAEEAQRIGLLNAMLPVDGFREAAIAWCQQISQHPAGAVFAARRAVVEGLRGSLADGLALETQLFVEINASDDAKARNAAVPRGASDLGGAGRS